MTDAALAFAVILAVVGVLLEVIRLSLALGRRDGRGRF